MKIIVTNHLQHVRKWLEKAERAVNDCEIAKTDYLPLDVLEDVAEGLGDAEEQLKFLGNLVFRKIKDLKQ